MSEFITSTFAGTHGGKKKEGGGGVWTAAPLYKLHNYGHELFAKSLGHI